MSIALDIHEWQKVSFATHTQLVGLALPEDDRTQQVIEELSESGRLKIIQYRKGLQLETASHVGRIAIGDLQITIHPKIKLLPLLRLMQYAYGLRQLDLFSAVTFDTEALTFQDLLINQLALEVSDLLSHGLQRHYAQKNEMLVSPQGRISFQHMANQGGVFQASLPCTHYLRVEDCLINQVVLQGVRLGIQLAHDERLRLKLQHLEHFHFSGISSIKLNWSLLNRARREMNRLTTAYLSAITLIEILFAATGISMDEHQQTLRLPGFLFDMNMFFQNLLSRFLKEHLPEYEVRDQFELDTVMIYVNNPRRRQALKLRPDYVIQHRGKTVAILDAKYRDLWQDPLPSHMLYQLVMYAMSQDVCNSATILYPTTIPGVEDVTIEIHIPSHQKRHVSVILRPVDLLQLDALLRDARECNNMRMRVHFAEKLIHAT